MCACVHACACVCRARGGEGGQGLGAVSPPASEHPAAAHMKLKLPGPLIGTPCCALFREFLNSLSFYCTASLPTSHPRARSQDYWVLFSLICFSDLCSRYRNIRMKEERKEERQGEGARAASKREGAWRGPCVWPHFTEKS